MTIAFGVLWMVSVLSSAIMDSWCYALATCGYIAKLVYMSFTLTAMAHINACLWHLVSLIVSVTNLTHTHTHMPTHTHKHTYPINTFLDRWSKTVQLVEMDSWLLMLGYRVQNNSRSLVIFQLLSLFDQSNSFWLDIFTACTLAMEWLNGWKHFL